jgi:SAM-dependent methyltransferase
MPAPCPACQGPADHAYRTYDYNQRSMRDAFDYFRCQRCGLIFLEPIPVNLGDAYSQAYYAIPHSLPELARETASKRYQIDLVRRYVTGGRLLDIGPGHGAFAFLAKEAGFDVTTIELDAACCQFLREVVGVAAIQSDNPAEILPTLEPQDVITLWHVIEHLPDPWTTLALAAERLAPGGILLVAAPNPAALQFALFRSRWVHLDAPRHVALLPAPLLVRRLVSAGLQPVLVTASYPGGRALNRYGWRASLLNLSRRRLARAAAWRLGVPLGLLAAPLERGGLRGSAYTAIFRKPGESLVSHAEPT